MSKLFTEGDVNETQTPPPPLIRVEHLSRVIETRIEKKCIVDDLTFTVPAQSLFAINGPSGSGKSTVLNLLTGIDRPTGGHILFGGEMLLAKSENALARWRGRHVGIVFQFFQLIPTLTALENVLLALELGGGGGLPRRLWRERAMYCLAMASVQERAHRLPGALSGGEQQRVAIARALANDPPVVIADEPTGNLDSHTAQQVFDTLAGLTAQGKTVIYVTHDPRLAALVATYPLPYDQLRAQMLSVPNVARVERFDDQFVKTPGGQVDLEGVETDTHLYHYHLLAGRWFRGDERGVMLISDLAAGKLHVEVGDKLTFANATDSATWTIIGEVFDHNDSLAGGAAITTIDDLYAFAKLPVNLAAGFMIQARDSSPQAVERLANALDTTLIRSGARPHIQTVQQIMASNQDQFQIVTAILYAVSVIIGLVGLLGLFNTLTISVLERRREIGILRAMGASGWRVARVFWTEGLSLAVVAWIAALVAGIPAAYAFVNFIGSVLLPLPFTFAPITLAIMLAFILLIATFASFAPALSAARVRVSDILRYD